MMTMMTMGQEISVENHGRRRNKGSGGWTKGTQLIKWAWPMNPRGETTWKGRQSKDWWPFLFGTKFQLHRRRSDVAEAIGCQRRRNSCACSNGMKAIPRLFRIPSGSYMPKEFTKVHQRAWYDPDRGLCIKKAGLTVCENDWHAIQFENRNQICISLLDDLLHSTSDNYRNSSQRQGSIRKRHSRNF